jgi:hypothetical protein
LGVRPRQLLDESDIALGHAAEDGGELEIHESYHTLIRSVTSTQPRLSGDWHALLPFTIDCPTRR